MADILEVKRRLASRAQAVAEYLLPNGIKESNEWRVGSVAGEKGKSLGVPLAGSKSDHTPAFAPARWTTRRLPLSPATAPARHASVSVLPSGSRDSQSPCRRTAA